MILKFTDFINEARKSKKEITDALGELFSKKKAVKVSDKTQKGIYSLAGIIQYFKDNEMSSQNATDALHAYNNDKELKDTIKNVSVEDSKLGKKYPYYYAIKHVTKEEADKIKSELEKDSKEKAAPELAKRAEMRKKSAALSKEKKEKKPTTTKTSTRKTTTKK
jgi:hypothetical protein